MSARWFRLGLAIALLAAPTVARADPKDDARRHFAEGLAAAQAGNYQLALDSFLQAEEAFPHPATLFNIAKAYSDLGDDANALAYYRRFREAAPDAAATVDPLIAALEARMAPAAPTPAPAPVTSAGVAAIEDTDVQRLREIAEQLQKLTSDLASRAPAEVPQAAASNAVTDGPSPPSTVEAPPAAAPAAAFIPEAYEKVVVSASRVGQDPLDSPSTVTILSSEDIASSPAFSVPDLLRRVVGVDAMSLSASQTEISIRGFNRELNDKVLVLIDGRSTYVDLIGSNPWGGIPITLDEIDRIEVIRGPGSAVYGANAVTGVINIITKPPGENAEQIVRLDAGTPGIARVSGMASGRQGATAWRFTSSYNQHGVWAKEAAVGPDTPLVPFSDDQDLALDTLQADARIDRVFGEKGLVSVSGGINDGTYEFYNIGALGDYGMTATQGFARADATWDPLHLRVFWNTLDGVTGPWLEAEGTAQSLTSPIRNDVVDTELEAPLTFETGSVKHTLNLGIGWRYKSFRFGYLEGGLAQLYTENHFDLFANESAKIDKLTLVGSLRIDRNPVIPDIGKTISPRGSVIYRLFPKTSVRATAGTAFRAPTPVESYMDFDLGTSANGAYVEDFGNRNLDPERILTLEAGIHDESTFYHMADVALFYNRVTDLIGLDPVTLGPNPFDAAAGGFETGETGWTNLPAVYAEYGAELDTEFYPLDGLDLYANLSLNRITETDGDTTLLDQSTSLAKINAGFTYRTPWRVDVTGGVHYSSPQVWRLREFDALGGIQLDEAPLAARVLPEARVAVRPLRDEGLELAINAWNFPALLRSSDDLAAAGVAVSDAEAAGADTAVPGDGVADRDTVTTWQEHPKGQPVGGRLYGTVTWRF